MRRRLMMAMGMEEDEVSKNAIVQKVIGEDINTSGSGVKLRVQNPRPEIVPKVIIITMNGEALKDSSFAYSMFAINKKMFLYGASAYENTGDFNSDSEFGMRTCRFKDDYFEFYLGAYFTFKPSNMYVVWIYDSDNIIELERIE